MTDSPLEPAVQDAGVGIPQPSEVTTRERDDAMGAYLMMFASWAIGLPFPLINLVASLVYYFVNKKTSRFVAFHAYQALVIHVPIVCINAGLIVWIIVIAASDFRFAGTFLAYFLFLAAVNIIYIVYSIIALIQARKGRMYYIPFFGRLAYARFSGPWAKNRERGRDEWVNRPPEGF
jgi:uncharacterized Tic20 family protein